MAGVTELATDRLLLRDWLPRDREPFAALNADPLVMEYFTPAVEVGWRLSRDNWGHGHATEAARAAAAYGFDELRLPEIVSFTSATNRRSQRVMQRLGMQRDPAEDFDHPDLPPGQPLCRHVLYRLARLPRGASSAPTGAARAQG